MKSKLSTSNLRKSIFKEEGRFALESASSFLTEFGKLPWMDVTMTLRKSVPKNTFIIEVQDLLTMS